MKAQFDVWHYDFPAKGPHPVVLISHPDLCARAKHLNVLFCTSQRQGRKPYPYEVMLDRADGLDWETFADCSILYLVESGRLLNQCGHVGLERRREIRTKLREFLRLSATD
jgi:mRNA-degrading endonuclease toxin of MazEF toxin-antitoxin module